MSITKIYGTPLNNILNGGIEPEEIYGFAGKDTLNGGGGNDLLFGGEGADTYLIGKSPGKDEIENYDSDGSLDVVRFTQLLPDDIIRTVRDVATGNLSLVTANSQLVVRKQFLGAAYQVDQFVFADGTVWQANDKKIADKLATVQGTTGNDMLVGVFDWSDTLEGLAGNDQLSGGLGDDTLLGGAGNDLLVGGDGNDNLQGGADNDELYGEKGNDKLAGGTGNDLLQGMEGNDSLDGGGGNDKLYSHEGNDDLTGGIGDDYLDAGAGNDSLAGGAGKDILLGGSGNDSYYITDLQDMVYDESGDDTVYVAVDDYKVPDGIEHVVLEKNIRALPYFVNALLSGGQQFGIGQAQTLTYSFVTTAQAQFKNFAPYTAAQQVAVHDALAKYTALTGITFVEKPDNAAIQLRFYRDDLSAFGFQNYAGYGSYPPDSDVHINVKTQDMSLASAKVNGNFTVLLHEIGHALGLKHLFEKPVLSGSEDTTANSVMSYNYSQPFTVDLGLFDKAALHYLYGVNHQIRAENNTYTVADRYIWDGAGIDTLDASAQIQSVTINLKPGSWNYVGTKATSILANKQFFIGYGTDIEQAIGGSGDDTLTGTVQNNRLIGGKGNDVLSGLAGDDALLGGEGKDILIGGTGQDRIVLTETKPQQDIVRTAAGDSTVIHYDTVIGFKTAAPGIPLNNLDKLDLPFQHIADNVTQRDGINADAIASHHIDQGLITFDVHNAYVSPVIINEGNFMAAVRYVQLNVQSAGDTVVFNALGNSYVFQNNGTDDTLIELMGITASSLSHDGLLKDGIWIG